MGLSKVNKLGHVPVMLDIEVLIYTWIQAELTGLSDNIEISRAFRYNRHLSEMRLALLVFNWFKKESEIKIFMFYKI